MVEPGQNSLKKTSGSIQKVKSGFLKGFLIVVFLMLASRAAAPGLSVAFILVSEPVDAYERLMIAIIMVESSGDTLAFNLREEARGPFQIRPVRLKDYNRRTGKCYTNADCFNYNISKEIFLYYAKKIGYPDYQSIARKWNGSGRMTLNYWEKVKKYL